MSEFQFREDTDGHRLLRMVRVGELSPEALREQGAQRARERELTACWEWSLRTFGAEDLPAPEKVGVDTAGLSKARADLVVLYALQKHSAASVEKLEAESEALKARPLPSVDGRAQEALTQLDHDDRAAYAAWLKLGGIGARPALRTAERSEMERQIAAAQWESDVQRETVREGDVDLVIAKAEVAAYAGRKQGLIAAVMQEAAAPIEAEIDGLMQGEVAQIAREIGQLVGRLDMVGKTLAGKRRCLIGLAMAAGQADVSAVEVVLPHRQPVVVRPEECGAAEAAWREFARQLESDPRAQNVPLIEEETTHDHAA